MGIIFIIGFVAVMILGFANLLFGKALENKGIIGDIANIIEWLFRHWWLLLLIVLVVMFFS